MKNFLFNICFVLIGLTVFTACNNGGSNQNTTEQTTVKADSSKQTNPEMAAVYSCPMHPEVTSNEPGKCPKCGMNLEEVAATDHEHADGEQH